MTNPQVTETDIVDLLMGVADEPTSQRVRKAVEADPRLGEIRAQWEKLLPAIKMEGRWQRRAQSKLVQRTVARLQQHLHLHPQEAPAARRWGLRIPFSGWPGLAAVGIAALLVLVPATIWIIQMKHLEHVPSSHQVAEASPRPQLSDAVAGELTASYVKFDRRGSEQGTSTEPFSSLGRAVSGMKKRGTLRIHAGSTGETLRITKPITLTAVGGLVRIGDS